MKEEQIFINNNSLTIEGLLSKSDGDHGVLICHPHPLMGGSMHNNVVEAIQEAFASRDYTTLRFNFRGVGRSSGSYDEGIGEQEDVRAVCKYLQNVGILKLSFAGYSFGSWVGAKLLEQDSNLFCTNFFVSPPINYFDFDFKKLVNKINMIVSGNNDQCCNIDVLKKEISDISADLRIIPDTDHFYFGKEMELKDILQRALNIQKK